MKNKIILLFFIYLFSTCRFGKYVEYNTIEGSIKVPSNYYITSIDIRCDSGQSDISFRILLKDLKNGNSEIYLKNEYANYYKEIIDTCKCESGRIIVNFVSTSDTTDIDCYWGIYRIDKTKPIVKLRPYRI